MEKELVKRKGVINCKKVTRKYIGKIMVNKGFFRQTHFSTISGDKSYTMYYSSWDGREGHLYKRKFSFQKISLCPAIRPVKEDRELLPCLLFLSYF